MGYTFSDVGGVPVMATYEPPGGVKPAEYLVGSKAMKAILVGAWGIPENRVHVVEPGELSLPWHEAHRRILDGVD